MSKYTDEEICSDYRLWCEYVDKDGLIPEDEFNKMGLQQKLNILDDCFKPEEDE